MSKKISKKHRKERARMAYKAIVGDTKSFEDTFEVFEFYWNLFDTHPDISYEEAEIMRLQAKIKERDE